MALLGAVFALAGCEGDDGKDGADGADGLPGEPGEPGEPGAPGPGLDPIENAIASAQVESCGTCHEGVGDGHQAVYDEYVDTQLAMEITDVQAAGAGPFTLTIDFTVTKNDLPYIDPEGTPLSLTSTSFYSVHYEDGEFKNPGGGFFPSISGTAVSNGDGSYTLTSSLSYNPLTFPGGAIVGRIANDRLDIEDRQADKRVAMYADLASAAFPIGNINTYESAADVAACEACHGKPYRKHANLEAVVAEVPNFVFCSGCHNSESNGNHPEWPFMVDDPVAWANGELPTPEQSARYAYKRTLMNDVHMSHAMELPYPQSMANCATCHTGDKLAGVLDNSNFEYATCKSCHPVEGAGAWPGQAYAQSSRATPFAYLWGNAFAFHLNYDNTTDCTGCHEGQPGDPGYVAPGFEFLHTGYDARIYDAAGNKYADNYTVAIDSIELVDNLLTVAFSSNDPDVKPEILISFYGWDTKDFLIHSHARDGSERCPSSRGNGCRFEWGPGDTSPLITEDALSVPGSWIVTADLAEFVPTITDDIPTLIANGDVSKIEVTVTGQWPLAVGNASLTAATQTYDIDSDTLLADYFQGDGAIVDYESCNACHDQLAVTFHSGSGRAGEITMCRNCHNVNEDGGHIEMASRSIDNYVHAIHSFQDFDLDETFKAPFDPVFAKRYDMHIEHAFPYFTAMACKACHESGKFNVPDQTKSMPGVQSESWELDTWYSMSGEAAVVDPAGRNIGFVAQHVTGPASRACGACHRAEFINEDDAGHLASFNAHTKAFGTYVSTDVAEAEENEILYGIIDKIMGMFK
jgi:hypothetical protein